MNSAGYISGATGSWPVARLLAKDRSSKPRESRRTICPAGPACEQAVLRAAAGPIDFFAATPQAREPVRVKGHMFKRILIANRGEIACRIIKTARKMGIATVAVYSDADRDALHVEMADEAVNIGPPAAAESYLVIDKIVAACKQTGARSGASGLRLPLRTRGVSARARSRRHRVHRAEPARHRRDGRQDRVQEGGRRRQGLDRAGPSRRDRRREARREDRRRDRLSGDDQGLGRRRRQGHAHRVFAGRGGGRVRALEVGGEVLVRRRPHVHREVHRRSAPHRNPGARRQARQRHLSRRARMLDPAPQPESHRGSAVAAARRGDAAQDGRAGRRAGERPSATTAPARSSSSPGRTAASSSSR